MKYKTTINKEIITCIFKKYKILKIKYSCFLIILSTCLSFHATAQSARMVFIEEATQASCGACAAQNGGFNAILDANTDKVTVLKYHTAQPGYDRMNLDNPEEVESRLDYYNFGGVPPVAFINGAYVTNDCGAYEGAPACLDQFDIITAHNSTSVFDLEVSANYVNNTLNVTGTLTANEPIDGNLKLRLALAEQAIQYDDAPGGTNGETQYTHVFKKFVTGAGGTELNDSWSPGDSYTFNESLDLTGVTIYDYTTLELIAFVQDDSDRNVLQAAKDTDISLSVSFADNAVAFGTKGLPEELCTGEQTIAPILTLQNGGNNTLTSIEIMYNVNGGAEQSFTWAGTLATLDREDIVLPDYTFTVNNSNTVSITIQNPNGTSDENMSDNTVETNIAAAPETTDNTIILQLTTDNYPEETTWQMRSASGGLLFNGGPYTEPGTDTVEMLLPQNDCYEFEIFDEVGDGICCALGQGGYLLTDNAGNQLAQGAQFNARETSLLMLANGETINNNASIIAYSGLNDVFFCDTFTLSPILTVRNIGANDITDFDIEVRDSLGNTLAVNMLADTVSMASGEETEVQLADILLENTSKLSFHITTVNGIADNYTNGNTYTDVLLTEVPKGYGNLTMTLNTDCWPDENTWEVLDEAENIVASGGPYQSAQAQTMITENFALPADACYEFVFYDLIGDGLYGEQWEECSISGNISLSDVQGNVLFEYDGSHSVFEKRGEFSYNVLVHTESVVFNEGLSLHPNPTSGSFTLDFVLETSAETGVSIHNMLGAEMMTLHLGTLPSGSHIQNIEMGDLPSGIYLVRLNTDGGSIAKKVVLAR